MDVGRRVKPERPIGHLRKSREIRGEQFSRGSNGRRELDGCIGKSLALRWIWKRLAGDQRIPQRFLAVQALIVQILIDDAVAEPAGGEGFTISCSTDARTSSSE